jgi:hypothetical protein
MTKPTQVDRDAANTYWGGPAPFELVQAFADHAHAAVEEDRLGRTFPLRELDRARDEGFKAALEEAALRAEEWEEPMLAGVIRSIENVGGE